MPKKLYVPQNSMFEKTSGNMSENIIKIKFKVKKIQTKTGTCGYIIRIIPKLNI